MAKWKPIDMAAMERARKIEAAADDLVYLIRCHGAWDGIDAALAAYQAAKTKRHALPAWRQSSRPR